MPGIILVKWALTTNINNYISTVYFYHLSHTIILYLSILTIFTNKTIICLRKNEIQRKHCNIFFLNRRQTKTICEVYLTNFSESILMPSNANQLIHTPCLAVAFPAAPSASLVVLFFALSVAVLLSLPSSSSSSSSSPPEDNKSDAKCE